MQSFVTLVKFVLWGPCKKKKTCSTSNCSSGNMRMQKKKIRINKLMTVILLWLFYMCTCFICSSNQFSINEANYRYGAPLKNACTNLAWKSHFREWIVEFFQIFERTSFRWSFEDGDRFEGRGTMIFNYWFALYTVFVLFFFLQTYE